jgi:hypothetical protein
MAYPEDIGSILLHSSLRMSRDFWYLLLFATFLSRATRFVFKSKLNGTRRQMRALRSWYEGQLVRLA